jgi:DNA-binding CsgD family transcriptional regulator
LWSLVEGREGFFTSYVPGLLAEAQRLLPDAAAEATAREAQAIGERIGNRLLATQARLTLGRLAAARGDWTAARQHALAHLDACAEGGHATYVPPCLGRARGGRGGPPRPRRCRAAAESARAEIGAVRVPLEAEHWAAIDNTLREALGGDAYQAARGAGTEPSIEDAVGWARRARGPRRRPPGGWGSLTPTEAKVVELVSEGLTNRQIGERMFISTETVKAHVAHIFKKLDVHRRAELTALAMRRNRGS